VYLLTANKTGKLQCYGIRVAGQYMWY